MKKQPHDHAHDQSPKTGANASAGDPTIRFRSRNETPVTRRRFLFQMAGVGIGSALIAERAMSAADHLKPLRVFNPLSNYPNRDWEKVYRDLYASDSSFVFLCAPNDTHNCLLRGHVKNGVVTRIAPTYGYSKATDLEGNRASQRWDPRCCQKGLALVRRFYGDRRCKRPMVRKGFKQWVDDGFPRHPETALVDEKYLKRGEDPWIAVPWDEAFRLSAAALDNIARTYDGEEGQAKLWPRDSTPSWSRRPAAPGPRCSSSAAGCPPSG